MGWFSDLFEDEKLFGAVQCNPMTPLDTKKSGALLYAIETSALKIGYNEYRAQDAKMGSLKEINKVYKTGKDENRDFIFSGGGLDFMPTATVLSPRYKEGVNSLNDHNLTKISNKKLMKAMGLDMEALDSAMVGTSAVPVIGSKEWIPYRKSFIASGGSIDQEATFRSTMVNGMEEKREGMKDVQNMSVGYFGRIDKRLRVAPAAIYDTFLEAFMVSGKRGFTLTNKDIRTSYAVNEWYEVEMEGLIKGNDMGKLGYSKIELITAPIDKKMLAKGNILNSDDSGKLRDGMGFFEMLRAAMTSSFYVSIQVQTSSTTFKELLLGGLDQRTVVANKEQGTIVSSAMPPEDIREADGFDAEEYYLANSFIPLSKNSVSKVKLFQRANLLIECKGNLTQVLNIVDIPWYAQGWFKVVVFVVSMIINWFTFGVGGTALSFIIQMAIQMAVVYAISYLIKALVDAGIITSGWVAAILQIVLTVVAAYYGVPGITFDLTSMSVIMQLLEATGKAYAYEMQIESKNYKETMARIKKEKDKLDDLDDEFDKMHSSSLLGRLQLDLKRLLDAVDIPLFESRAEFLQRTTSMHLQTEALTISGLRTRLILP